jgi:hypothetical protein
MNKFYPLLTVITLCVIGVLKVVVSFRNTVKEQEFAIEFLNKYREFLKKLFQYNVDGELYQWLKLNGLKMQKRINVRGISCGYKPAGANYIFKDYQLILNGISNLLTEYRQFGDSCFGKNMMRDEATMIDDLLLTYIGELESEYDYGLSEVKNPLIWFREGVRTIVVMPISFLYWSGLIHYRTYSILANNFLVKLITFFIAFIGLIGSIVTIVTGYEPFFKIINVMNK